MSNTHDVAMVVANALNNGEPAIVAYEPGNATRYDLAFLPHHSANTNTKYPMGTGMNYTTVALLSHGKDGGAYPFLIGSYISAGYVSEKLHVNNADATWIADLLNKLPDYRRELAENAEKVAQGYAQHMERE